MPPVLVKDLMSSPVVSLFEEQTLPLARDIMHFKHVRHLPVIDERKRLVGLVSQRDLLAAQLSNASADDCRALQDDVPVGSIMTRDVIAIRPTVKASVAAATLRDHKFGCLPVVDESYRLIGIVTEHDFLELATQMLEALD
jgi:CBS domain-containing membrane protein